MTNKLSTIQISYEIHKALRLSQGLPGLAVVPAAVDTAFSLCELIMSFSIAILFFAITSINKNKTCLAIVRRNFAHVQRSLKSIRFSAPNLVTFGIYRYSALKAKLKQT